MDAHFIFFLLLWLSAFLAGAAVLHRLRRRRDVRLGGPAEDLERARRLAREALLWSSLLAASFVGIVWVGETRATAWRTAAYAVATLDGLTVLFAAAFIQTNVMVLRYQWFGRGTRREWAGWLLAGVVLWIPLALVMKWRWA